MIYTPDDLRVVREDLADSRKELERAIVQGGSLDVVTNLRRWVAAAEELERKVCTGLGEQNITEAAKVLGATVERGGRSGWRGGRATRG